jgi:hypothetical protein
VSVDLHCIEVNGQFAKKPKSLDIPVAGAQNPTLIGPDAKIYNKSPYGARPESTSSYQIYTRHNLPPLKTMDSIKA